MTVRAAPGEAKTMLQARRKAQGLIACCVLVIACFASSAAAQEGAVAGLRNGGFEQAEEAGEPAGWRFFARPQSGQATTLDPQNPFEGSTSALLDCSRGNNQFTNLMQALDATTFRGQRARFRAAVRTADLPRDSRVQLWFRVDRGSERGGFDNMQDRPIRTAEWQSFDIVLDVADDATLLNVGIFVIGVGKAWIDDASLEPVAGDTPTTSRIDPAVFAAAGDAPRQSFFTPWLWLAVLGCLLFVLSQAPTLPAASGDRGTRVVVQVFALRFSLVYWLVYSLPQPFTALTPSFLQPLVSAYAAGRDRVVRWFGEWALSIEETMVAPNGSGDTTYAYVGLLVGFVVALLAASVWTLLDRGARHRAVTNDLLRSYLRYVLAATMIGYGLAKAGFATNQFPSPGDAQLGRTYGSSSPMGLLWTFMGASRGYTFFAGMGETIGGVLLLWRRTTLLGSLVVVAVMTNVVMLNFWYDVPVKQYSVHLVLMALFLLLPERRRLLNLLVRNRKAEPADLRFVLTGPRAVWFRRILKTALIIFILVIPLASHTWKQIQYLRTFESEVQESEWLLMNRGFRWINEVPFNR